MSRIGYIVLVLVSLIVLVLAGFSVLETYEDHMEKLSFSNFYQPINYYKLNLSFWIEVFQKVNVVNNKIPWYETFLTIINVIGLVMCFYKMRSRFDVIVVFLFVLIPQLVFINFTRTAILATTVLGMQLFDVKSTYRYATGLLLLLLAASIRWQMAVYTLVLLAVLYVNYGNYKRFLLAMAIIAFIPLSLYIHHTTKLYIQFYETEPYLVTLNDANVQREITNPDEKTILIKDMARRWIIPERAIINERSLAKITYAYFWEQDALKTFVSNLNEKLQKYHNRDKKELMVGYLFLLLPLLLIVVLRVDTYKWEYMIRIAIVLGIIGLLAFLVKLELRVLQPSMAIVVLFVLHKGLIKTPIQKGLVLLVCIGVVMVSLIRARSLNDKLIPDKKFSQNLIRIAEEEAKTNTIAWDVQSVALNFEPAFKPYKPMRKNLIIEEPYIDILSQMPCDSVANYMDFVRSLSNQTTLIVDKERFSYICRYLQTFYNYDLRYTVLSESSYPKKWKVNVLANDKINVNDCSFWIIRY